MTTARLVYEATSIELSKIQAPSLKLYEFNYLFNKAINLFINEVYNIYDINLQTTDDLRVLKSTAYLTPLKVNMLAIKNAPANTGNPNIPEGGYNGQATSYLSQAHTLIQSLHGATYEVLLPLDYLHLLNCICIYYVAKLKDCWDKGSYIQVPATRLTADSWASIVSDIYNRPSPMRPYYYIHNVNTQNELPTNPINNPNGTDIKEEYHVTEYDGEGSNFKRTFLLNGVDKSLVEKPIAVRVSNISNVRMEIRYGYDDSVFLLAEVHVDYVKCPQFIRLTQELIDLTEDTSQMMEFPDYVTQEITNKLVHLIMERINDPRLSNNMQITQSIARPTGQLQQA